MIIMVPSIFINVPDFLSAKFANFRAITIEVSDASYSSSKLGFTRICPNLIAAKDSVATLSQMCHLRNFGRVKKVKEHYSDRG